MRVNDTNRALVLAALYNASRPQGLGWIPYAPKDMTEEEAQGFLKDCDYFDYLKGRVMKIYMGKPGTAIELDFRLYDRDNGQGAGEQACKGLEI
jgi:hypothetical protein